MPLARRGAGSGAPREKLALVIPALREAENLRLLLGRVRAVLSRLEIAFEIVVVDDDSRDGTHEIVSAIAVEDTRVRLLVRTGERGLSGAVLHGWRHTDATILGVMDADGQHPAEAVPELVTAILGGRDLVIGSRYVQPGSGKGWHPLRGLLSAAGSPGHAPVTDRGQRSALGLFRGSPPVCGEHVLPANRFQTVAGDPGSRADQIGGRGPLCLWRPNGRSQQIESQGGMGLPGLLFRLTARVWHRSNSAASPGTSPIYPGFPFDGRMPRLVLRPESATLLKR